MCHVIFIFMSYQLLTELFDWSKLIRNYIENSRRLNVLLMFVSIAIGYMVSSFFLSIIQMSQDIFRAIH
ncbi:DUF1146 family protein [Streptococcus saliviloxodontae]|nr:DUF1146 family protein [Streptococcus saliviloxodontae]